MSIPADGDTDSTESDGEYDSEHDPVVDMRMEDNVDTLDSVDLDGDVDMERDGDDEVEEDEEEEDEDEEEEKHEEEDKDEDDGKEPRVISQGEMVNTSADDADTKVDDQPIVLPEQGQEMGEHTPRPQPPATIPGASPTSMNSGDSSPQWAAAFGARDAAETTPGGANSVRS